MDKHLYSGVKRDFTGLESKRDEIARLFSGANFTDRSGLTWQFTAHHWYAKHSVHVFEFRLTECQACWLVIEIAKASYKISQHTPHGTLTEHRIKKAIINDDNPFLGLI